MIRYAFDANGSPVPSVCVRCGLPCDALAECDGITPDECGACYAAQLAAFNAQIDRMFYQPARAIFAALLSPVCPPEE